jgi:hypothetical protein
MVRSVRRVVTPGLLVLQLVWLALVAASCGRSDLDIGPIPDGGLPDVGADTAVCNAASCPSGCCDSSGACQAGTLDAACGTGGAMCSACGTDHCNAQSRTCTSVPSCTAENCTGCCDQASNCQLGTQTTVCGSGGSSCQNCSAEGFTSCAGNACVTPVPVCDPSTCPNGCCEMASNEPLCVDGSENISCGSGGQACQNCQGTGDVCSAARQCVTPTCGPGNCSGCCFGNQCIPGTSQNACGTGGQQCMNCGPGGTCGGGSCIMMTGCGPQNCTGCCQGDACIIGNPQGAACGQGGQECFICPPPSVCGESFCIEPPPDGGACGPETCGGCCDPFGNCQTGENFGACGQGGQLCQVCPPTFSCTFGFCEPPLPDAGICGPQNCSGCCDGNGVCQNGNTLNDCGTGGSQCNICPPTATCTVAGVCQGQSCSAANCSGCCDPSNFCEGGFLDTACGSAGAACSDCTQSNGTCDTAATPRVCSTPVSQCPSTFGSCAPGTTTPTLTQQSVCPTSDLSNAEAACQAGADSPPCVEFFAFENMTDPACASCLAPFDVDYLTNLSGVFACAAPFVSQMCNQESGCYSTCVATTCAACSPAQLQSCEGQAENDQCELFEDGVTCVFNVIEPPNESGPGTFCAPLISYGSWLQTVGQFYCGQ